MFFLARLLKDELAAVAENSDQASTMTAKRSLHPRLGMLLLAVVIAAALVLVVSRLFTAERLQR